MEWCKSFLLYTIILRINWIITPPANTMMTFQLYPCAYYGCRLQYNFEPFGTRSMDSHKDSMRYISLSLNGRLWVHVQRWGNASSWVNIQSLCAKVGGNLTGFRFHAFNMANAEEMQYEEARPSSQICGVKKFRFRCEASKTSTVLNASPKMLKTNWQKNRALLSLQILKPHSYIFINIKICLFLFVVHYLFVIQCNRNV